jgi:hypothetical protein
MQVLSKPLLSNSAVGSSLPFNCPECHMPKLAITTTINGFFDKQNFSIQCTTCGSEFLLDEILEKAGPQVLSYLPDGESVGAEKFDRGREGSLLFGKGLGSNQSGKTRSEQFRYVIDLANDWKWNPKKLNGKAECDQLYVLKATVGLFEDDAMKSTLEMISRKIKRIEKARHIKISEPMVDRISKLIRKGVSNAEARRPTTSRDRRLIVETTMARMGLWPE